MSVLLCFDKDPQPAPCVFTDMFGASYVYLSQSADEAADDYEESDGE